MAKTSASLTITADTRRMQQIIRETPHKLETFLDREAEDMVNDIKLSFGTGPAGRSYKRGGKTHIASAPPGPPAVDTDALRDSIKWRAKGRFQRIIEDGVEHGAYQELGTEHITPRPFMGPAFERKRQNIAQRAKAWGIIL